MFASSRDVGSLWSPDAHSRRLIRPHANPEQVHFLAECWRISEHSVVSVLRSSFRLPRTSILCSAEAADVREEIQMIQRDLEGPHLAHRWACHRARWSRSESVRNVESINGMRSCVTSSSNAAAMSCMAFSISGDPKGFATNRPALRRRGARSRRPSRRSSACNFWRPTPLSSASIAEVLIRFATSLRNPPTPGEQTAPRRCACHIMLGQRSSINPNLCSRESEYVSSSP